MKKLIKNDEKTAWVRPTQFVCNQNKSGDSNRLLYLEFGITFCFTVTYNWQLNLIQQMNQIIAIPILPS